MLNKPGILTKMAPFFTLKLGKGRKIFLFCGKTSVLLVNRLAFC